MEEIKEALQGSSSAVESPNETLVTVNVWMFDKHEIENSFVNFFKFQF